MTNQPVPLASLLGTVNSSHESFGALQSGRRAHAHGKFTAAGKQSKRTTEVSGQRQRFDSLPADQQNDVIEFLKSLPVLPPGSKSLVVDQHGNPKH